jgi:beta-lactamase regulating signal transducer with metallopeptidase domain
MNIDSVLKAVLVRYVLAQASLLPLMLLSWLVLPRTASLRFQWVFHRVLVVLAVVLPILLALPVSFRIVHEFGDLSLLLSATTPASVEADDANHKEPAPLSPPPPADDTAVAGEAPWEAPETATIADRHTFTFADALDLLPALFAAFSALGIVVFLAGIGRQAMRERSLRRSATAVRRIGKVRVVVSDIVRSPFSTGLLRPRIYLPTGIARSERARRMVLAHESTHVRHAHIAWTFLEHLHAALLWYNPLAHLAATNGMRLRELVCDRDAGRIHGDTAYCRVLLDAAASLVGEHAGPGLANGWIGRRFLRRRIEFLSLGMGKTSHGWVFAAAPIAALVGLAVLIGCGPRVLPEPAAEASETEIPSTPSYTTLTQGEGTWPGATPSTKEGTFPAYRDAVIDTAATGWNLGTGRLYNLWSGPDRKLVLGVNNPDGFWFTTTGGDGVEATAFNDDIHTVISGLLLHLPFLQRIWAGLRASDPDLQGETGFTIAVDNSGRVTIAEPDPAKPGNARLAKAYAASMKTWTLTAQNLSSAYRMRIPITSFLRQYPPNDYRVMSIRLQNS